MLSGNAFKQIEKRINSKSQDEIIEIAKNAGSKFIVATQMQDPESILKALIMAASIGLEGTILLSSEEKQIVDAVFGEKYSADMATIYDRIKRPITAKHFEYLQFFSTPNGMPMLSIAEPLLTYVLCFALIDGKLSSNLAEHLEQIFGIHLLTMHMNGDLDDFPSKYLRNKKSASAAKRASTNNRKKEADKYGIEVNDLDKHKKYLEAKKKMSTVRTSNSLKQVQKTFDSLKGYLDSESLSKECGDKIEVLIEKENKKKRMAAEQEKVRTEKEKEQREKRAEAQRIANEKKKIVLEQTKQYVKECLDSIEKLRKDGDLLITAKKEKLVQNTTERIEVLKKRIEENEKILGSLGFFALSEKKKIKSIISNANSEIFTLQADNYIPQIVSGWEAAINVAVKDYEKEIKSYLNSKYSIEFEEFAPKVDYSKPKKSTNRKINANTGGRTPTAMQLKISEIAEEVLTYLKVTKKKLTVSEMMEEIPCLAAIENCTPQYVVGIIRPFGNKGSGIISRTEIDGAAYFYYDGPTVKPEELYDVMTPYEIDEKFAHLEKPESPNINSIFN